MASTYENDLRLEEMATGENSGSWGTKTNTNLELIADAFSYGTETIADADTTITIADGAADAARSLALKINSSADLTTTRTITLAPNTTSKVWIIENNTSGGQTLTISAGSGSNVTLANGTTKIIATDGIGAGSNVVELTQDLAIADMSVDGILSLADGSNSAPSLTNTGDLNTGLYFPAADEVGITVGGTQVFKADSTGIDVTGTITFDGGSTSADLSFGDNDKAIFGAGSDLQIYHDGSHSRLLHPASSGGDLYIQADDLYLTNANGNTYVKALSGGAVTLAHNNADKLATTSTGIDVTGEITADGLTVDGVTTSNGVININSASYFVGNSTNGFRFNNNTDAATLFYVKNTGEAVFNDNSLDYDFRVESAISTHAIFLDAENGKTGINNAGPFTPLDVNGYTSVHSSNDAGQLYLVREQSSISGDNIIGRLSFSDTDGVTNGDWTTETHAPVMIQGVADEAHGASDRGGRLEIWTKDNNSATTDVATKKFQISHNGTTNVYSSFLGVNGTDPVLRLNATNTGGGSGNPQLEFYRDSALYGSIEFIPNVEMRLTSHNAVGSLNFHAYGDNQRLSLGASAVFNDPGNDYDFRVESPSYTNLLFVDAGNNNVNVRNAVTTDPSNSMNIRGNIRLGADSATRGDTIRSAGGASSAYNGVVLMSNHINAADQANSSLPSWLVDIGGSWADGTNFPTGTADSFTIARRAAGGSKYSSAKYLGINSTATVINEDSNDHDFRVESDSNTNAFHIDAERSTIGMGSNYATPSAPSSGVVVDFYQSGIHNVTITRSFSVDASSSTNVDLDLGDDLGIGGKFNFHIEIDVGGYGNSSSGPLLYKWVGGGYSTTAGSMNTSVLANSCTNGSVSVSRVDTDKYRVTITNTNGTYSKFGVVKFNVSYG